LGKLAAVVVVTLVVTVVVAAVGTAGPVTAILVMLFGMAAYLSALRLAKGFSSHYSNRAMAAWTAVGMVALSGVLVVQIGLVIYAGRTSWNVVDRGSCPVAPANATPHPHSCLPVNRWQASTLVLWHLIDAAPLAKATSLTQWEVPAHYSSAWVGVMLIYAKVLLVGPFIKFFTLLWKVASGAEAP
jgi:hypothetical protein